VPVPSPLTLPAATGRVLQKTTTGCSGPPAPTNLSLTLAWDYVNSGQTGFELLRCQTASADCTPTTVLGSTIGPTLRQVTDATIVDGQHYCYTIRAVLSGQPSSALSAPFCLTVDATITLRLLIIPTA
jgi:hypothetical protein